VKVVALDYGSARTGVAVSDETGTLARPVGVVRHVRRPAGMAELIATIGGLEPERVVVGLPLTLRGEHGAQAVETLEFVQELTARCPVRSTPTTSGSRRRWPPPQEGDRTRTPWPPPTSSRGI